MAGAFSPRLTAAGIYGYPREEALQVAMQALFPPPQALKRTTENGSPCRQNLQGEPFWITG